MIKARISKAHHSMGISTEPICSIGSFSNIQLYHFNTFKIISKFIISIILEIDEKNAENG